MTPRKLIYSLGHLVGILGAAWCFYCREWAQGIALLTGVGCLRFDPPEGSAPRLSSTLPITFGAVGVASHFADLAGRNRSAF